MANDEAKLEEVVTTFKKPKPAQGGALEEAVVSKEAPQNLPPQRTKRVRALINSALPVRYGTQSVLLVKGQEYKLPEEFADFLILGGRVA